MTAPRSTLVSLDDTPWYHCVNRCVRRAYLCGEDQVSGQSYEHRRGWVVDKIKLLSSIFAIDVAAYAVMSNHYHVVVRVDALRAVQWTDTEVLERWTQLFKGPLLVQQYLSNPKSLSAAQQITLQDIIALYRKRLFDLSWFMRVLNESIARQANKEDGVKGHFWEGRFKSQALLDEVAVLSAMAYVDLNPIRAGIADSIEASDFTSIQERLKDLQDPAKNQPRKRAVNKAYLMPFDATAQLENAVPIAFTDYLELVAWSGRHQDPRKTGHLSEAGPKILARLNIAPDTFNHQSAKMLICFANAVGLPSTLAQYCAERQVRYLKGMSSAKHSKKAA